MKKTALMGLIIVVVALGVGAWALFAHYGSQGSAPSGVAMNTSGTTSSTLGAGTETGAGAGAVSQGGVGGVMLPVFNHSLSNGVLTFSYPSKDFGLAANESQLLVHSYIPPCDQGFDYCLYYVGNRYAGTNFESAGIALTARADLATESACLTTAPSGYTKLAPKIATSSDYAVSAFFNVGNAAAGHFANDTIYRIAYRGHCEQIDERIGQTVYGNYPSGTIKQFTKADQTALASEMNAMLGTITLSNGTKVSLPQPAGASGVRM